MIVFWIFFVNTLVSPARNSLRVGTVFPTRVGNQANRASIVYKEYPKTMFRTYLKNTSSPRCERFCVPARRDDEGVSSAIRRREATTPGRKTAATLRDMANFRNSCVDPPRSTIKVHHRRRSLALRKLAHIAGGGIFEIGSREK